jgi:hypothetical protein
MKFTQTPADVKRLVGGTKLGRVVGTKLSVVSTFLYRPIVSIMPVTDYASPAE